MLAFFIITLYARGGCALFDMPVRAGQKVNLPSGISQDLHPTATFALWHRLDHGKKTLVASMWRKIGSPWKTSVANNTTFAISNDGSLVINRMFASLEGEYVQSYRSVTYVDYYVHITRDSPRVDIVNVMQRYEESVIPNGVKRTWHIKYNVSTRQASDCRKTVHLCRRKSTDADKPEKCESGEIKLILHVNTCEFTLVYNDTSNNTAQFYVEFYPSDVQGSFNPQLFLLSTKNRGWTDPPATTNRSHKSETTTTIASKSKIQTTITTPKGHTVTKKQGVPQFPTTTTTQTRTRFSASNPSTKEQDTTGFLTTEQSRTNPTKGSSSSGMPDHWKVIIGVIFFLVLTVIAVVVVINIHKVRKSRFGEKVEFILHTVENEAFASPPNLEP